MLCLSLILSVLILNTSAKLLTFKEFDQDNGVGPNYGVPVLLPFKFVDRGNPLWVVSLSGDGWMAPKLRLGNTAELEEFYNEIGPLIRRVRRLPPVRVKKDDPEKAKTMESPQRSDIVIKKDFMNIINKFAFSASMEPDAYINDNSQDYDNSPSIVLYIKGTYASLTVKTERKQWFYFIANPSILPEWFYEIHDTHESPILIPEDVKYKLFSSLLRYLHGLFGFPQ